MPYIGFNKNFKRLKIFSDHNSVNLQTNNKKVTRKIVLN